MNTADSTVTVMNIPQIIECFSPSSEHRVSPILHEVLPHSQLIARFHHDEFPRERNQVGILVSLPKKLHRVSPVVRTSQYQFSTLEKTKHGRHPTLSSLLRRNFP